MFSINLLLIPLLFPLASFAFKHRLPISCSALQTEAHLSEHKVITCCYASTDSAFLDVGGVLNIHLNGMFKMDRFMQKLLSWRLQVPAVHLPDLDVSQSPELTTPEPNL